MGAQNNCFLMEQGLTKRVGEREAEVPWIPSARRAASLLEEDEAISAHGPGSAPMLASFGAGKCCSDPPLRLLPPQAGPDPCSGRPRLQMPHSGAQGPSSLRFWWAPCCRPQRAQLHP